MLSQPTDNTDRTDKAAAQRGFSLIELAVVVALLVLVIAILIPFLAHMR